MIIIACSLRPPPHKDSPSINLRFQSNLKDVMPLTKSSNSEYDSNISNQNHSATIPPQKKKKKLRQIFCPTGNRAKMTTQAPLVCRSASRGWSAPKAFAQDSQHQEGLKVRTNLAVFSKDLHLSNDSKKSWGLQGYPVTLRQTFKTWQGKTLFLSRKYILRWSIFHCICYFTRV